MKRFIPILLFLTCCSAASPESGPAKTALVYRINPTKTYQTMHSFGASDAWRTQHVGLNWPAQKRERIADWLFSMEEDENGNPRGIGLSLWRFNIGSGSFEQGEASGIGNAWNRVECFLSPDGSYDFSKQAGQQWFLQAARRRGVGKFLAFTIAPPWFMSLNGKTTSQGKTGMNIRPGCYDDYARFLVTVIEHFAAEKGIVFDYLSPVNEPQWDWNTDRQEGTFATNADCYRLIRALDDEITRQRSGTKIVFGEAGAIKYLYEGGTDTPATDNQIHEFFSPEGSCPVAGLANVLPCVSGHSYWSTWDVERMISERKMLRSRIEQTAPGLNYWQTEYCVMENNPESKGGGWGRDLGMDIALYVARIIHYDLTVAGASAWHWWTAVSPYDYKDGLIYLDDGRGSGLRGSDPALDAALRHDGTARDSKLMWALGNFSRFVRPGMVRLGIAPPSGVMDPNLLISAYRGGDRTVVVVVNQGMRPRTLALEGGAKKYRVYETSETSDLSFKGVTGCRSVPIPARSVVTLVSGA